MPEVDSNPINRGGYLGMMLGALCLGVGLAMGVAVLMSGSTATVQWAAIAFAVGASPTLLPGLIRVSRANWGTLVFAGSAARMLLIIAVGYAVATGQTVDRRPFWFGLLAGTVLVLVLESIAAAAIINRREHDRAGLSRPHTTP